MLFESMTSPRMKRRYRDITRLPVGLQPTMQTAEESFRYSWLCLLVDFHAMALVYVVMTWGIDQATIGNFSNTWVQQELYANTRAAVLGFIYVVWAVKRLARMCRQGMQTGKPLSKGTLAFEIANGILAALICGLSGLFSTDVMQFYTFEEVFSWTYAHAGSDLHACLMQFLPNATCANEVMVDPFAPNVVSYTYGTDL